MQYEIKRNGIIVATVRPESGGKQKEIMLTNIVPMSFKSPDPIHFQIGDYVDVWGERYILNELAEPTKDSTMSYQYSMTFQAHYYSLAKVKYRFYDEANVLKVPEFELMGTLEDFLNLAIANANRLQSGWIKGDCGVTEYKLLTFSGENVLQVLDQLAKEFDTEWWIFNKNIHMVKKGENSGHKFEYGFDKGLRGGLKRTNVDTSSVFSRLTVLGSDKNLPSNYRNSQKRLGLPSPLEYLQGPVYGNEEIEHDVIFEDIRPERIGTVSSVGDKFTFSDLDLPFDVNAQELPGLAPKVSFLTGHLAGYDFEIAKGGYKHATRTFKILKSELEKFDLPGDVLKPAVGDTYYLFDIAMPDSYVNNASERLLLKGNEYFAQNAPPKVAYTVPPDHFFFQRKNIKLNLGDYAHIKDHDLLLDKNIRMVGFTQDLHNEFLYTDLKLSDIVLGSAIVRQYAEQEKLTKVLALNKISNINRARMNWKSGQELMNKYFDPSSGSIYTDAISPISIRSLMIQTGDVSQQLEIPGIVFTSNYDADANKINWTGGNLNHATIAEQPVTWNITGATVAGLDPAASYYIYARCERNGANGVIIITQTQIKVDEDPNNYHFWIGFANSVVDNYRIIRSLYGSVRIYGRTIEGGRILGENLDIDLDAGTIRGKVTMLDGSYTAGTVVVGDPDDTEGIGNAFISGITDQGDESVRFGAGGQRGDVNLPFKVLANGKMFAKSGKISEFNIDGNGLTNTNGNAYVAVKKKVGSNEIGASIGAGLPNEFWGGYAEAVAVFINTLNNASGNNVGAVFDVANGVNNFAIDVKRGALLLEKLSSLVVQDSGNVPRVGLDVDVAILNGGVLQKTLKFVKGVLVTAT